MAWTTAVREQQIPSRRLVTDAAIVAACTRVIEQQRGARVLDVGCGEGWLARTLAKHGALVTGIDASVALVETARAAGGGASYAGVSYEMLESDPTVVAGPWELIVCNFALLDDRVASVLAALARRRTATGTILVHTVHPWMAAGDAPYVDGWRMETFASFDSPFPARMPWYFRTLHSWISAATEVGLVVHELEEPLYPDTQRPASLLLVLR